MLNKIYSPYGDAVFNKNNIVILYPSTDLKSEVKLGFQYMGTAPEVPKAEEQSVPETPKEPEAPKDVEVPKENLIQPLPETPAAEIKPVVVDASQQTT